MELMERTGLIVTPGSAFGSEGEGYIRMALVAGTREIGEILQAVEAADLF